MPFYGGHFHVVCIGVVPHKCCFGGSLGNHTRCVGFTAQWWKQPEHKRVAAAAISTPTAALYPPQQPCCTHFAPRGAPAPPVLFPHPMPAAGIPFLSLFRAQHSFCTHLASWAWATPGFIFHWDFKKISFKPCLGTIIECVLHENAVLFTHFSYQV